MSTKARKTKDKLFDFTKNERGAGQHERSGFPAPLNSRFLSTFPKEKAVFFPAAMVR